MQAQMTKAVTYIPSKIMRSLENCYLAGSCTSSFSKHNYTSTFIKYGKEAEGMTYISQLPMGE
jgi:heterodisulfide reductase subunit C